MSQRWDYFLLERYTAAKTDAVARPKTNAKLIQPIDDGMYLRAAICTLAK